MVHAAPRHIRDVQQAIDAAKVDEHTEVGNVLDHAHADLAFLEFGEQLTLLRFALFFNELAARDDDVHALFINLDDARFDVLANPVANVASATNVDLRSRQEDWHANVDEQATLDLAERETLNGVAFLVGEDDVLPTTDPVCLALAKQDVAFGVVDRFNETLDLKTWNNFQRVGELVDRDLTFSLVANVDDHDAVFLDLEHLAAHDLVRSEFGDGLADRFIEFGQGGAAEGVRGQPRQLVVGQCKFLD